MKVTVTGGTGFLGKSVVINLLKSNKDYEVKFLNSSNDLRNPEVCRNVLADSDIVIHLAARVGGILANRNHPAEFFYDNSLMSLNVVHTCHEFNIKKLIVAGTVCSYPCITPSPFRESDLWNGYPEVTNAPYGVSKRILGEMCRAYNAQYGLNYIYLLPTNMFGINDDYDDATSHIIPATIKKINNALKTGKVPTFCGTGEPTREFLNVRDAARALVLAAESNFVGGPINLGSGDCHTIKYTISKISNLMGYNGPIQWDDTQPNGQPHRFLDCTLAKETLGFKAEIPFEDGLREAIADFHKRYPDE